MKNAPKDFFESIGEFPHSIGIYLTYTLDTRAIDKLSEYATGTILILHDYTQGKCLEYNRESGIITLPVKALKSHEQNCFHSKLALLKSEGGAKLIVGSANLTSDSFNSEKQIAFEKELEFSNEQDVFLYNQVLQFLGQLAEQMPVSKDVLKQTLEKLRNKNLKESKSDIQFVFNCKGKSIFDSLSEYIANHKLGGKSKGIKIATPFVSSTYPSTLKDLKKISDNISVYLRKGAKIEPFVKEQFNIFQPAAKKRRDGFHAKLVLIEYERDAVLYIGSANFTEQGFFKTADKSSNQECGIILTVSIHEMNTWFANELWKQLTKEEIRNYSENEKDNSTEWKGEEDKFYGWAEKKGEVILTYIYNPLKLDVTQNGNPINLKTVDNEIQKTEKLKAFNEEKSEVRFEVDKKPVKIVVFDFETYNTTSDLNGESLFAAFKGKDSIDPNEVDVAIKKDKITVVISSGVNVTEPPILEQYFYNVKEFIESIKRIKYFSSYNEKEVEREFDKSIDIRTSYLALHLYKIFWNKTYTQTLAALCKNKIDNIPNDLSLDSGRFNNFLKAWRNSKT